MFVQSLDGVVVELRTLIDVWLLEAEVVVRKRSEPGGAMQSQR